MDDKTIPPVNRKSGTVRTRVTTHLSHKNGGWKSWLAAILGGLTLVASGVALLIYLPVVPWYVGAPIIVAGLQIGSRGAFSEALKGIKDIAVDLMRARKESA